MKPRKKAAPKRRAPSESGSEYEEPSDGGGSDYEPDEPVKVLMKYLGIDRGYPVSGRILSRVNVFAKKIVKSL